MRVLERLIQILYQEGTKEKNKDVLRYLRLLTEEKATFFVPTSENCYLRLKLDDHNEVYVAFTSQEQMEKEEHCEIKKIEVMEFLEQSLNSDLVSGLIINPWKESYYLPKLYLEMILDGKNLDSEIEIKQGDITSFHGDCIVNAANSSLLGGGGVDGAIHRKAGQKLLEECRLLHGCKTGQAKITQGYQLNVDYIIHTVGPIYSGIHEDAHQLEACYWNSLNLAKAYNIHSIAFPCISCGVYGYPIEEATPIALKTVAAWLDQEKDYAMKVSFYCFDQRSYEEYRKCTTLQES